MELIQVLSNIAGLVALGVTIVGAIFVVRSNIGKAANDAQTSAIQALQADNIVLRNKIADIDKENTRKITDIEKENARLEHVLQTIISALKMRGTVITIQGEMINVEDAKGTTVTRIQGQLQTTTEEK